MNQTTDRSQLFLHSQTKDNLLRAFAGESQARNRYTIAARIAEKAGLAVIQGLFLFTADQEAVHAQQFYRELADFGGQNLPLEGTYPIDIYSDLLSHLRAAQHNEYQEWEQDYRAFARTAMEEGFPLVGKLFENIAQVEQVHGDRFGLFADMLEREELFSARTEVQWICLHCGFTITAQGAPARCPVCRHPQGFFVQMELAPFSKGICK